MNVQGQRLLEAVRSNVATNGFQRFQFQSHSAAFFGIFAQTLRLSAQKAGRDRKKELERAGERALALQGKVS